MNYAEFLACVANADSDREVLMIYQENPDLRKVGSNNGRLVGTKVVVHPEERDWFFQQTQELSGKAKKRFVKKHFFYKAALRNPERGILKAA